MSADRREASSSERVVATTNGTEGSSGSSITTASGQSRSAKVTETTTARSETRGGKLITTEVTERVKETPRRTVTTAAGGDVSVSGLERVTSKRERVTNTSLPGVREESFRTEIRSTSSFESQSGSAGGDLSKVTLRDKTGGSSSTAGQELLGSASREFLERVDMSSPSSRLLYQSSSNFASNNSSPSSAAATAAAAAAAANSSSTSNVVNSYSSTTTTTTGGGSSSSASNYISGGVSGSSSFATGSASGSRHTLTDTPVKLPILAPITTMLTSTTKKEIRSRAVHLADGGIDDEARDRINKLQMQWDRARTDHDVMVNELRRMLEEREIFEQKIESLNVVIEDYEQRMSNFDNVKMELLKAIEEFRQKVVQREVELETAQQQYEQSLTKVTSELSMEKNTTDGLRRQLRDAQAMYEREQAAAMQQRQKTQEAEARAREAEARFKSLEDTLAATNRTVQQLEEQLQQQQAKWAQDNEQYTSTISSMYTKVQEANTERDKTAYDNSRLKTQIDSLIRDLESAKVMAEYSKEAAVKDLKDIIAQREAEIQRLRSEVQLFASTNGQQQQEISELHGSLEGLKVTLERSRNEHESLVHNLEDQLRRQREQNERNVHDLDLTILRLQDDLKKQKAEADNTANMLRSKVESLTQDAEESRRRSYQERTKFEETINSLRLALDQAKKEKEDSMTSSSLKIHSLEDSLQQLQGALSVKLEQISRLEGDLQAMHLKFESQSSLLMLSKQQQEQAIRDLEEMLQNNNAQHARAIRDLEAQISVLQDTRTKLADEYSYKLSIEQKKYEELQLGLQAEKESAARLLAGKDSEIRDLRKSMDAIRTERDEARTASASWRCPSATSRFRATPWSPCSKS
jgi:chromosome segregation ATPase